MSITLDPTAPPGQPNDMPPIASQPTMIERVAGLEETVRRVLAERDQARNENATTAKERDWFERDRDRYLAVCLEVDSENRALRTVNERLHAEVERHERAAQAKTAVADAASQRTVGGRAIGLAAASGAGLLVGVAALVAGFALNQGWLIAAGAAVLAASAGTLARIHAAADPNHPFDLGPAEVGGADA